MALNKRRDGDVFSLRIRINFKAARAVGDKDFRHRMLYEQ